MTTNTLETCFGNGKERLVQIREKDPILDAFSRLSWDQVREILLRISDRSERKSVTKLYNNAQDNNLSIGDFLALTDDELLLKPGIGVAAIWLIDRAVTTFREEYDPEDSQPHRETDTEHLT